MFKKTLAAVALLGAFAGSAVAADVTLYGVVDYGLQYTHVDSDKANTDAVDNFQLSSGNQSLKVVQNRHDTQVKMTF